MTYVRFSAGRALRLEVEHGVHPTDLTPLFTGPHKDRLAAAFVCEFWAAKAIRESGNAEDAMAVDLFADAERILAGGHVSPWMDV